MEKWYQFAPVTQKDGKFANFTTLMAIFSVYSTFRDQFATGISSFLSRLSLPKNESIIQIVQYIYWDFNLRIKKNNAQLECSLLDFCVPDHKLTVDCRKAKLFIDEENESVKFCFKNKNLTSNFNTIQLQVLSPDSLTDQ